MAGKIKQLIDTIVEVRSKGNETIRNTTLAKIMLKGVNPDIYNEQSPDNEEVIARIRQIAGDMGVKI
ncbi:MAG: hypothetical protein JXA46_01255 [Dehalococcoidales bacterium]|nr:hypothetical protein [Dehalococcoidales bacterium]